MKKAFEIFSQDLASLRTGRANVSMLDIIKVDVYGQMMPINQLATLSTPDPRTINVQVWDQNNVTLIDSSIKNPNLELILRLMDSYYAYQYRALMRKEELS